MMISWFTFIFFTSFVACCYHRVFFNFRLFHGWKFSESSGVLWYSGISCEGCGGPLTVRPACNKLSYKTTFAGCLIGIVFSARKKKWGGTSWRKWGMIHHLPMGTEDSDTNYCTWWLFLEVKNSALVRWLQKNRSLQWIFFHMFHV